MTNMIVLKNNDERTVFHRKQRVQGRLLGLVRYRYERHYKKKSEMVKHKFVPSQILLQL